tara:strand:+ start:13463 stop:14383 length:921 start_codon:yes stop_codon:yes gene_type:complete
MTVAPANEVMGYIDRIDSGFIFGWGLDKDSNNDVSTIMIETSDGQIVAKGVTEIFRGDLVKKGIAEKGTNGFQLPIHIDAKLKPDSKLNLYVNGNLVEKSGKATLEYHNGYFWGAVLKLPTSELNCTIVSESFEGESNISLYHNEGIIYRQPVMLNKGENFFKVNIPHALFDNTSKLISLGVDGFPFLLWSDYIYFADNLTPWEYLKSSSNSQGMMALSKQAQFRYESLALNLNNQIKSSVVGAAHNVIAEGWQGRKKFPKLTLPKHDNPDVSIIIPAYNKFELTYNCIASIILAFNKTSYEVVVA